jgi:inner membrane protein
MMAATHVLAGTAAWSGVAWLDGGLARPESLAAAALGSLLPDLDHPKSWIGRRVGMVSLMIAAVFGHRGITHSLLAVVGCLFGMLILGKGAIAPAVLVGYLSHLACDSLTKSGVPLLWPWRRPFGPRLLRTGGLVEFLLAFLFAGATGLPWAAHAYPQMMR